MWRSVGFFLEWNQLTDAQRAVSIITIVEATLVLMFEVGNVYRTLADLPSDKMDFVFKCLQWDEIIGPKIPKVQVEQEIDGEIVPRRVFNEEKMEDIPRLSDIGEIELTIPRQSIAEQAVNQAADGEAEENVEAEFSGIEAAANVVLVAMNISICVQLGIDLNSDWNKLSANIKAMDAINLGVVAVQVMTGTLTLYGQVFDKKFAFLPEFGFALCLAGLIMTIVE